jgi:hypothetical protein
VTFPRRQMEANIHPAFPFVFVFLGTSIAWTRIGIGTELSTLNRKIADLTYEISRFRKD